MTVIKDLLDQTADAPDAQVPKPPRGSALQSAGLLGILAGLQAAIVGLFLVVVPLSVVWLTTPKLHVGFDQVARISSLFWLAAHGTRLSLISGQLSLAPLGLTAVFALCCTFFARRVQTALRLVDRGTRTSRTTQAHVGFVGAYVLVAVVVAVSAAMPDIRPQAETAALGSGIIAALAGGVGLWSRGGWWRRRAVGDGSAREVDWLRAALAAVFFGLAVSVVILGGLTLAGYSRIQSLYDALHPGAMGGFWLGALQFSVLPNLATWVLAFLGGSGFAVGTGTSVTMSGLTLGPMPALPILGILPQPGPLPAWVAVAGPLVLVVGGAFGGRVLGLRHRRDATPMREALLDVLASAGLAGLTTALLTWFASGSLGPGAMSQWGANALLAGLSVAGLSGLGMLLTASVLPRLRRKPRS